jgi:oligopeptide/dipeptide ABC transporter ATP-binding protein
VSAVDISGLSVAYDGREVVHDVHLHVPAGSVTALVGESGCGKSSTALAIARLLPGTATTSGTVRVGDVELGALSGAALRQRRGSLVGYVPQSTSSSLNPVRRVGTHLCELLRLRDGLGRHEARERAAAALAEVEIDDPERVLRLYQHQLSGGMRQRVSIALALALRPEVLIADEPTTALDTTVQSEILALVGRLRDTRGMTIVWITHDLGVVGALADRVAVMYAGWIVEQGETRAVFEAPRHPYTRGLLESFRSGREGAPRSAFVAIDGHPPTDGTVPGCPFHPRCAQRVERCSTDIPLSTIVGPDRTAACHLVEVRP